MASVKQTILDPGTPKGGNAGITLGSRNDAVLKELFPGSPIHDGTYSDAERTNIYQALLGSENVVAKVESNEGTELPAGTEGLGLSSFSTKFTGGDADQKPPNFTDMAADTDAFGNGKGQATTPYIPYLGSTSTGDENGQEPFDIAAADLPTGGDQYGSGHNYPANPYTTSEKMDSVIAEDNGTIGSYLQGVSYAGSDGT